MTTQTLTTPKQHQTADDKIQQLRQLFADTPQFARTALENTIKDLAATAAQPRSRMESAGRTGPDISHLIGFGILLTAALLIAIGSFGNRSGGSGPAAEAGALAAVDSRAARR